MKDLEETGVTPVRDRSALGLGTLRRRRYSPEQKKAILAEAASPGTTVTEVSRRHQVTRSLIHNWRRQEAASLLGATVKFTPVRVDNSAAERALRGVALGRKNWLFAGSDAGGQGSVRNIVCGGTVVNLRKETTRCLSSQNILTSFWPATRSRRTCWAKTACSSSSRRRCSSVRWAPS
ncbi:MAG: transposase [Rhodospirillales bacterium]|nr:transposase [Rhodospirillales bacterium]